MGPLHATHPSNKYPLWLHPTLNHPNGVQGMEVYHPNFVCPFGRRIILDWMQKRCLQELPLSDQKHLTGDSLCPRRRWQVGVKMNLHKNPLSFFTFSLSLSLSICSISAST